MFSNFCFVDMWIALGGSPFTSLTLEIVFPENVFKQSHIQTFVQTYAT